MAENNQTVQEVNVIHINQQEPVDQSDLTKYVDLKVSIPCGVGRDNQNEEFTSLHSGDAYTMVGDKIGERFLSTSYVDISLTTGDRATITRELLGVTSIDISFDANLYPIVTMNFVDVRGMALFGPTQYAFNSINKKDPNAAEILQQTSQSFFKSLFAFPYPIFTLTVKGYYGPAVKFDLQVQDFKSSFDSNTGDFNITVVFIGYMYGCLADIPMSHVLTAPYFDSSDSQPSEVWKSENFTFDNSTDKIPTIVEFFHKFDDLISQRKNDGVVIKNNSSKTYINTSRKIGELKQLKSALVEYNNEIINAAKNDTNGPNGLILDRDGDTDGEVYLVNIPIDTNYNELVNNIKNAEGNLNENTYTEKINKIIEGSKNTVTIENEGNKLTIRSNQIVLSSVDKHDFITFSANTINEDNKYTKGLNKESYKDLNEHFVKHLKNTLIDTTIGQDASSFLYTDKKGDITLYHFTLFDRIVKEIEEELKKYENDIKNLEKDTISEISEMCRQYIGFVPSAKNIYKMLFAHLDTLYKSINKCAEECVQRSQAIFNNDNSLEFDYDTKGEKIHIPAFPYVAKKQKNNSDNSNNNNAETYVPIFPSKENIDNIKETLAEVEYVERIYNNLSRMGVEIKKIESSIQAGQNNVVGDYGKITPTLPSDYFIIKNPYECVKNNAEGIAKILVLRMRTNKICGILDDGGILDDETFLNTELENIWNTTQDSAVLESLSRYDLFKQMKEWYGGENTEVNGKTGFKVNKTYKLVQNKKAKDNITEAILWVDNISEIDKLIYTNKECSNEDTHRDLYEITQNKWFQIGYEKGNEKKCDILPLYYGRHAEYDKINDIGEAEEKLIDLLKDKYSLPNVIKREYFYRDATDSAGMIYSNTVTLKTTDGDKILSEKYCTSDIQYELLGNLFLTEIFHKINSYPNILQCTENASHSSGRKNFGTYKLKENGIYKTSLFGVLLAGALLWAQRNKKIQFTDIFNGFKLDSNDNRALMGLQIFFCNFNTNIQHKFEDLFLQWARATGETVNILGKEIYSLRYYYTITNGIIYKTKIPSYDRNKALSLMVDVLLFNDNMLSYTHESYRQKTEVDNRLTFGTSSELQNLFKVYWKSKKISNTTVAKEREETKKVALESKRNIYYSLKNIYDRWMCHSSEKYRLTSSNGNSKKSIYSNLYFYNYHGKDIGDEFMIDIDGFVNLIKQVLSPGNSMTVIEFMALLAEKNDCLFQSLPMNMNNSNLESVFEPVPWGVFKGNADISNAFIFYLPGKNSEHLNIQGAAFADDSLQVGHAAPITAFGVEYGKQNQNHFKNVNIDMSTSIMAEEEIANTLDIANRGKTGTPTSIHKAKSLFPVFQGRSFTCRVDMLGDMAITPMMHFELSNIPMFRGIYKILNVTHRITPEDFTTTFEGVRMSKFTTPINEKPIDITFMLDRIKDKDDEVGAPIEVDDGESIYKGAYNAAKEIWREIDGIRSSDYRQTLLNCLEKKQEISSYSMCTIEQSENLKNKGGCSVSILELLLLLGLICEKLKLGLDLAIVSGSRKELTEQSWVKLNTQHIGGRAVDIQGFKDGKKDKTLTAKLFIVLKAINDSVKNPLVGKAIDQLIWETHEGDGDVCPYPNTIHFSCKDHGDIDKTDNSNNRGEIFQSHVTTRIVNRDIVYDTKTVNDKNGNTGKKSHLFTKYSNFTPESLGLKD